MIDLRGRVAVVTGASRGVGRGVALAAGEAGGTGIGAGGRTREGARTEGLPGRVEEAAEAVSERGGVGVAVRCDHTREEEVEALFGRVGQEQGRLDVLVNGAWGGYEGHDLRTFTAPFWQQPAGRWDGMFTAGVRATLLASQRSAPLMLEAGKGLIVHVTAWDRDRYLGNLVYDVAKAAVNRMAWAMARELRPHGVAVVALAPGFVRTERVQSALAAHPEAATGSWLATTESPEYAGRAVAALAGDPEVLG